MIKNGGEIKNNLGKSPADKTAALAEDKKPSLMEAVGNTMISFAAAVADAKLPKAIEDALQNGILCEAEVSTNGNVIKKAFYGEEEMPNDVYNRIKEALKSLPEGQGKIDCDDPKGRVEEDCFCTKKNPALWCLIVMLHRENKTLKKKCRAEALTDLKAVAPKLWAEYNVDAYGTRDEDKHDKEFSGSATVEDIIKTETEDAAEKFCSAIDPAVEPKVKALFAADGFYWIAESVVYSIVFGSPEKTLEQYCTDDAAFKDSDYGKCVCKQETGLSFCILKVFAEFFKSKGYLDCTSTPKKFVTASKPKQEDLPKLAKAAPVVAPTPTPAPGPGNDPNATTAKTPDAAATSSLLIASLSVAAAMLLRH